MSSADCSLFRYGKSNAEASKPDLMLHIQKTNRSQLNTKAVADYNLSSLATKFMIFLYRDGRAT